MFDPLCKLRPRPGSPPSSNGRAFFFLRRQRTRAAVQAMAATNKCFAQSNKSRAGGKPTKKRERRFGYRRREMTKEEQVVGLIFQVTMWVYIAAAVTYVVIG